MEIRKIKKIEQIFIIQYIKNNSSLYLFCYYIRVLSIIELKLIYLFIKFINIKIYLFIDIYLIMRTLGMIIIFIFSYLYLSIYIFIIFLFIGFVYF